MGNPHELPLRPTDAAVLAETVYQGTNGRIADGDVRACIEQKLSGLNQAGLSVCAGSFTVSPAQPAVSYVVVDVPGVPASAVLLRFAPSAAVHVDEWGDSVHICRVRPGGEREIAVTAVPFGVTETDRIRWFTRAVAPSFLPAVFPQRAALGAGARHPEITIPAGFSAFGRIQTRFAWNAALFQLSASREMAPAAVLRTRDGETPSAPGYTGVAIEQLYDAAVWTAIRTGWRSGYRLEADHIIAGSGDHGETDRSLEAAFEAIRAAAGYTRFTIDTSRLFDFRADHRSMRGWSEPDIVRLFEEHHSPDLRLWALAELAQPLEIGGNRYAFPEHELRRLVVKFGRSLLLAEQLYDEIARVRAGGDFEVELSLDESETLTTAKELIFCMRWLRQRGRDVQLLAPNLGFKKRKPYPETMEHLVDYTRPKLWIDLAPRVAIQFEGRPLPELGARAGELSAAAAHFGACLSIHSGSRKQPQVLQVLGSACGGSLNFKISTDLQEQVFAVLREQPPDSPWRLLLDRLSGRAAEFAVPADPALAHLGTVAATRDLHSPDGDTRLFAEKLRDLPEEIAAEARRRNADYLESVAANLRS